MSDNNKWIIERLDKVIDLNREKLEEVSSEFHKFGENEISKMDKLGKAFLSATGFLITLVLGLAAVKVNIDVITYVGTILAFGVTMYLVTLLFKDRYESVFSGIENAMKRGNTPLYGFLGYFQNTTLDVDDSTNYLELADFFVKVTIPSLNLGGYYALLNTTKSIKKLFFLSWPAVKHLKLLRESAKKYLDAASESYSKEKVNYESNQTLKPLLVFGNALLDYKENKQTIPQMNEG